MLALYRPSWYHKDMTAQLEIEDFMMAARLNGSRPKKIGLPVPLLRRFVEELRLSLPSPTTVMTPPPLPGAVFTSSHHSFEIVGVPGDKIVILEEHPREI